MYVLKEQFLVREITAWGFQVEGGEGEGQVSAETVFNYNIIRMIME